MTGKNPSYWYSIVLTFKSLWAGLVITFRHILKARKTQLHKAISSQNYFEGREGIATIQYPHEQLPIPDTGRYRLHNEIDDCIVCDKCAKVCPVDCIDIEPIRAVEEFGKTSDGTSKRIYAAKFDIDMGKCCFCGLCTTVCPTECLTMTKVYDFSTFDINDHNYVFGEMTAEEIMEKKSAFETAQKIKAEAKAKTQTDTNSASTEGDESKPASTKPVFKPRIKPPGKP